MIQIHYDVWVFADPHEVTEYHTQQEGDYPCRRDVDNMLNVLKDTGQLEPDVVAVEMSGDYVLLHANGSVAGVIKPYIDAAVSDA